MNYFFKINPKKNTSSPDTPRMITTYSGGSQKLKKIMKAHWSLLESDPIIGRHIGSAPKVTYRRPKSIKDRLVQSYLQEDRSVSWLSSAKGFVVCKSCKACKNCKSCTSYQSVLGKMNTIMKFITCTSDYIIYVLECPCGYNYVGSTNLQLKIRILQQLRIKISTTPQPAISPRNITATIGF